MRDVRERKELEEKLRAKERLADMGMTAAIFVHELANPLNGISYYRLKQVDFDGKFSYSKVVSVNFSNLENKIRIEPNPSYSETTIHFDMELKGEIKVEVFNAQGKSVLKLAKKNASDSYSLNLESLESGLYVIRVENNQQQYRSPLIVL